MLDGGDVSVSGVLEAGHDHHQLAGDLGAISGTRF